MDGQALAFEIAVIAIQTRQAERIEALKNFLVSLPNPKQVEGVLAKAIVHCAATDKALYFWIVEHEALFQPELDLAHWSRRTALSRLLSQGCVVGKDFRFESQNCLWLSGIAEQKLFHACNRGENIVLRSFLHFTV